MIDFSEEIALIKKNFSAPLFLEINVKKEWRSTVSEYRSLIRLGFIERHPIEVDSKVEFLNLESIPTLKHNYISISHSNSEGGYAFSNLPFGFDLIERDRLNEKIVARVSTTKEILDAIDPSFLWPAKESVFKAYSDQLEVITEIQIFGWKSISNNFFTFNVQFESRHSIIPQGRGFVFEKSDVLYGLYIRTG